MEKKAAGNQGNGRETVRQTLRHVDKQKQKEIYRGKKGRVDSVINFII